MKSNKYRCRIEFLVAIGISFFFLLPTGIVQAVTNQAIGKYRKFIVKEKN